MEGNHTHLVRSMTDMSYYEHWELGSHRMNPRLGRLGSQEGGGDAV